MYYVLDREMVAEKEGFAVWRANGHILVPSSVPSKQLDTAHSCHIFLNYLFIKAYFRLLRNSLPLIDVSKSVPMLKPKLKEFLLNHILFYFKFQQSTYFPLSLHVSNALMSPQPLIIIPSPNYIPLLQAARQ